MQLRRWRMLLLGLILGAFAQWAITRFSIDRYLLDPRYLPDLQHPAEVRP